MASIGGLYALLGSVIGSAVQASTVSFIIATSAMLLFCLCRRKVRLVGKAFDRNCPWWMWLGGICGAITVYGNAWLIPKIGVGLFVMLLLIGQLLLSLLMEQFGWLGAPPQTDFHPPNHRPPADARRRGTHQTVDCNATLLPLEQTGIRDLGKRIVRLVTSVSEKNGTDVFSKL